LARQKKRKKGEGGKKTLSYLQRLQKGEQTAGEEKKIGEEEKNVESRFHRTSWTQQAGERGKVRAVEKGRKGGMGRKGGGQILLRPSSDDEERGEGEEENTRGFLLSSIYWYQKKEERNSTFYYNYRIPRKKETPLLFYFIKEDTGGKKRGKNVQSAACPTLYGAAESKGKKEAPQIVNGAGKKIHAVNVLTNKGGEEREDSRLL